MLRVLGLIRLLGMSELVLSHCGGGLDVGFQV